MRHPSRILIPLLIVCVGAFWLLASAGCGAYEAPEVDTKVRLAWPLGNWVMDVEAHWQELKAANAGKQPTDEAESRFLADLKRERPPQYLLDAWSIIAYDLRPGGLAVVGPPDARIVGEWSATAPHQILLSLESHTVKLSRRGENDLQVEVPGREDVMMPLRRAR